MNHTNKTFALIGFTLAFSKDLSVAKDERVSWRASKLHESAEQAASRYPSPDLNKSNIKAISRAISELNSFGLISDRSKLVPILSTVLCGIDDVLSHTKNRVTLDLFRDLEKKVLWLNSLVDPKLDQVRDYIRGDYVYNSWAN